MNVSWNLLRRKEQRHQAWFEIDMPQASEVTTYIGQDSLTSCQLWWKTNIQPDIRTSSILVASAHKFGCFKSCQL